MKRRGIFRVYIPLAALLVCAMVVVLERHGVTNKITTVEQVAANETSYEKVLEQDASCLVLVNRDDDVSNIYEEMICFVLDDMRVPYEVQNITEDWILNDLESYRTLVLTFSDWDILGRNLLTITDWVKKGGGMMNMLTPEPTGSFWAVAGKLGIENNDVQYVPITGIKVESNAVIGKQQDKVYTLVAEGEEPLVFSLRMDLNPNCEVILSSEDGKVPLLFKKDYGEGRFVIFNEVFTDKYQRGFVSLAYSFLEDVCIYPVINASAFYIDDLPSPIPEGDGTYIKRDYGISIASFYNTVWWPRIMQWGEQYHLLYTGLIIELYSEQVKGPFERNLNTAQFGMQANMLLNAGGELGFHGYNHMPLCISGIDNDMQFGEYKLWESKEDIEEALEELKRFASNLYPNAEFHVYVPPSNILSEEGKKALTSACPEIEVIASIYMPAAGVESYVQDFMVDEQGIIHTPRIVSGLDLDDYQKFVALAEMNYHYVQTHFMHPDDLLDEDRGASKGWKALSESFEEYLEWVYHSAPNIRNVTGSGMGNAVLQYDKLSVKRIYEENVMNVELSGLVDEAYFILRVNSGTIEEMQGGTYEQIAENSYLVRATQDELKIYLGE